MSDDALRGPRPQPTASTASTTSTATSGPDRGARLPLPAADEGLEGRVVALWWIGSVVRLVVAGVVGGPALATLVRQGFDAAGPLVIGIAGVSVLVALPGAVGLFAAPLRYRRFRFGVSDRLLLVRRGVLGRLEKVGLVAKVQHVDVDRSALERAFGLATLEVFTAGGRRATFQIPGLEPARARALRQRILEVREDVAEDGPSRPNGDGDGGDATVPEAPAPTPPPVGDSTW